MVVTGPSSKGLVPLTFFFANHGGIGKESRFTRVLIMSRSASGAVYYDFDGY